MYERAIQEGLDPDKFWDMTLRETLCFMSGQRSRDEAMWNHTASIIAYIVNVNSTKRQYTPAEFHPYLSSKRNGGRVSSRKDAEELVESLKSPLKKKNKDVV